MDKDIVKLLIMVAVFVLLFILGPIAVIWSVNLLFPVVAIPYNFWSWLAVWVLQGAIRTPISFKS